MANRREELGRAPGERLGGVFGRRLAEALSRQDISQRRLAEAMTQMGHTMYQSTIWKIQRGMRPVTLDEAEAFAELLHSPLEDLLAGDDVTWGLRQDLITLNARLLEAWEAEGRSASEHAEATSRTDVVAREREETAQRLADLVGLDGVATDQVILPTSGPLRVVLDALRQLGRPRTGGVS